MPKMTLLTVLPSLRTNNLKGLAATLTFAPKFCPVLSSPRLLDLPSWAVVATGAGAEGAFGVAQRQIPARTAAAARPPRDVHP